MRRLLLLLLLALPGLAFGQGTATFQRIVITDSLGRPLGGVAAEICNTTASQNPTCNSAASIYSDVALAHPLTCTGPTTCLTSDALGQIPIFFAAPGYYCYVATGPYIADTSCHMVVLYAASGTTIPSLGTAGQKIVVNQAATAAIFQDTHAIDLRNCLGVVGDGVHDDGASINTCTAANSGKKFYAPQLLGRGVCSYYSSVTIVVQTGTMLEGDGSQFGNGGTKFCFPTNVTGFEVQDGAYLKGVIAHGPDSTQGSAAVEIVPSAANLEYRFRLSADASYDGSVRISTFERTGGVATIKFSAGTNCWYAANQVIAVSGVAEDTTFNGTFYVSASSCGPFTIRSVSWAQAGAPDVVPTATAVGSVDIATTGTSTADGVRLKSTTGLASGMVENVEVEGFGRDGFHFNNGTEQDDYILHDAIAYANGGSGFFAKGLTEDNKTYNFLAQYNLLSAIHDVGFLGNSHYSPHASYNGVYPYVAGATSALVSISRTSGTVTFSTTGSYAIGNAVVFAGVSDASFVPGAGQISGYIASKSGSGTFTYTLAQPGYNLANAGPIAGSGTVRVASGTELRTSLAGAIGAYVIGLNNIAGHWTITAPYAESGQNSNKWNAGVKVVNPHFGTVTDTNWPAGLQEGYPGGGASYQFKSYSGLQFLVTSDTPADYAIITGNTANQRTNFGWLDYTGTNWLAQFSFQNVNNEFLLSDGDAATNQGIARFWFIGTGKNNGDSGVNARGTGGHVQLNVTGYYNCVTCGGTGGTQFGDGVGNVVATVDGAGKGTFTALSANSVGFTPTLLTDSPGAITINAGTCTDRAVAFATTKATAVIVPTANYALEAGISLSAGQAVLNTAAHYRACNVTVGNITLNAASTFNILVIQ